MSIEFQVEAGGSLVGELLGVEEVGENLRWDFRVAGEKRDEPTFSYVTNRHPFLGTLCYSTLAAILGRPLVVGEKIDLFDVLGESKPVILDIVGSPRIPGTDMPDWQSNVFYVRPVSADN